MVVQTPLHLQVLGAYKIKKSSLPCSHSLTKDCGSLQVSNIIAATHCTFYEQQAQNNSSLSQQTLLTFRLCIMKTWIML